MPAHYTDFDKIVRAYRDRYGVDLSHMRMKWSKHPVYTNGERSYDFADDETGGSWVDDGTVRINPDMRSVMNRFGVHDQKVKDFRNRIIAHELAHEVWFKQNRKAKVKRLIKDMLAKAREENFTTPYLDTYSPDTPKKKFDSELFAEYMSDQLNKKAQAIAPEEIEAMARPHYADSGSHGWNHIQDVLASARRMRRKELLKKELAALMYHDSSLLTGPRETHAEDSADIARKELAGKFSKRQLADIANAIAHHRASYEGRRKSKLEDLVAAADRDVFVDGNIDDYILRSYRYGLEHGMTPDEAVDNTLHHMPDKYGTKGYAYKNAPKIYMDTYRDELRKAQKAFDSLTADRIREISKSASSKRETYESGEGEVESYTPDKTEDHDEIVIRLKDGRRIRISNNTKLGKILKARMGSRVGYHGYRVGGTDVVHRVHPNVHSRGGWLERIRD